jgi:hypothetical protein
LQQREEVMTTVFEQKMIPRTDVDRMRKLCAWRDCTATAPAGDLPRGWVWLVSYWAPEVVVNFMKSPPGRNDWHRDGVLCPLHAQALDDLLKPIPRKIDRPQGTA